MEKMMKVGVLKEFGKPIVIEERPVPKPGPGEVLIKTVGCGLCGNTRHTEDKGEDKQQRKHHFKFFHGYTPLVFYFCE